ncbi:efflux RND transporter periplasmic adaptor subunit [Edaphobacter albus]|uniref:efflux RND transporter periplasmic adaptor subunit n=1 Tax=Edaphobacter sp. 4G125 TaxID=2763071 RepID=UPI0016457826|nr:efflux RND transporter periplasmic adaptor subunit [Edaphobacter sp. 4G125]QNI35448.1 efflux RND transporter periplasmic adaptor subunit [Edaphobacter sp. 4G125]
MSGETQQGTNAHSIPDAHKPNALKHEPPPVSRGSLLIVVVIVLLIAVVLGVFGILRRKHASTELEKYTAASSAPPVALETPKLQQNATEIVLPGNMQAYTLAPIYARTTGYVKAWYHDIGSRVRKGELLAVIETPELDQQLASAKADLATAIQNANLAKVTADRYKDLVGSNAVSQQDTDNAVSLLQARNSEVASASANVRRLEELVSFERVVAPFDGVITARNLDIGQLISADGSTTTAGAGTIRSSREIFDISAIDTLRVFVNVPQIYAPDAKKGVTASLTLPQYPGRTFKGKLVRTANAVDPVTRTLLAEIDVENRSGELLPGSYTQVHLNVSRAAPALIVSVGAVILKADGLHVATVDSNNRAHILSVTSGRDFGSTMEILSGLEPGQAVISNPPDSLTENQEVRVVTPEQHESNPPTEAHR